MPLAHNFLLSRQELPVTHLNIHEKCKSTSCNKFKTTKMLQQERIKGKLAKIKAFS